MSCRYSLVICLVISSLALKLSASWQTEQAAYSAQLTIGAATSSEYSPQKMERDNESPGVFRCSHDGLSTAVSSVRGSVSATPNAEGGSIFLCGANSVSPPLRHLAGSSRSSSVVGQCLSLPPAAFTSLHGSEQGTFDSDLVPMRRAGTAVPGEFVSSTDEGQGLESPRLLVPMTPKEYKAWKSGLLREAAEQLRSELYSIVRDILWDRFTVVEDIFYANHPDGGRYCDPLHILSFFSKWNSKPTNSFQLNYLPYVSDIERCVSQLIAVKEECGNLGVAFTWDAPEREDFLPKEIA